MPLSLTTRLLLWLTAIVVLTAHTATLATVLPSSGHSPSRYSGEPYRAYDRHGQTQGNPTQETDPLGRSTRSQWSPAPASLLASTTDADGASWKYHYDDSGNLTAEIDPLGRTTSYNYSPRGQLTGRVKTVAGRSSSIQFGYDGAKRLVQESRIDGTRQALHMDAARQVVGVTEYPVLGNVDSGLCHSAFTCKKKVDLQLMCRLDGVVCSTPAGGFMSDTGHHWKESSVNGGLLRFNRNSGTNVLIRTPQTAANVRRAPRSLQIGLLSPCNLSCAFCYRDPNARSVLTSEFLLDLLVQADAWGVLEVAFGGGEPLLFKGFVSLITELHQRTKLGLNFTTNGMLLSEQRIEALEGKVGEVRLSAYDNNRYRDTLRRARRLNMGVNLLVTPANVACLEACVQDVLSLGARSVLLLGYKGPDTRLHLDENGFEKLQASLRRMAKLPIRLDICWHPHLTEVDHLFSRSDCGAGDEFLVITPDRQIQACSFHHSKQPFNTMAELQTIYQELRTNRPAAEIAGCTRVMFQPKAMAPARQPEAWVWKAHASNNSGDWTIAARFCNTEIAHKVAQALRELSRQHEAFLASDEGEAFVQGNGWNGGVPTPPLVDYGLRHGFDWSDPGDGLWWEEDGAGASVLTAGVVGDAVVVYHPYCMGLPENLFRILFQRAGAHQMGYWQYNRPGVILTASGRHDEAADAVRNYAKRVRHAEYASDVRDEPPWGGRAIDPRVAEDEDNSARLADGEHAVVVTEGRLVLRLAFENTFAGTIAVENWLRQQGFTDIEVVVEDALTPLES